MHCLRCGDDIEETAVFCPACLEVIRRDPVSRETHVVIQPRPAFTPMRTRPPKPEELLAQSQKRIEKLQRIIALLCILVLTLCIILAFVIGRERRPHIGQNYTTIVEQQAAPSGIEN